MNREIKYRAIHTLTKHWFDEEQLVFSNGEWFEDHRAFEDGRPLNMKHCEIMRYTGLHDKNGTEISEGDILGQEIKGRMRIKGEIKFGNYEEYMDGGISDWTGFYLDDVEDGPVGSFSFLVQKLGEEVIGNIHEHPHLLERD